MSVDVGYLGNPRLKRAGVKVEFDKDQIQEYIKCISNPIYFIRNYCTIVNLDEGLVKFNMYDFQEEMVERFNENRFVICKMPRQVGKTTTVAAYLLWKAMFTENYSIGILAHKDTAAREILSRIQLMFENLPSWMQLGVVEWNKGNIELENGSKIMSSATSPTNIRGGAMNLVYLDEFAFVAPNIQEQFMASVYPTITSGKTTKILVTSTPNGMNMFYKLWVDSEEGRNSYVRVDVHWSQIPGRDEQWKLETIANTSEEQFRQEFECEFLGSSNTLISGPKLRMLTYREPIKKSDLGLKVYQDPRAGALYAMTVDTSRGTGQDYCAFIVVEVSTFPYRIVSTFKNNMITTLIFPNIIHEVARLYNNAVVLIETNDIGQQVADIIHYDLEYDGLLMSGLNGREGQVLGGGFQGSGNYGVKTTKAVKRIGCAQAKTLIETDKLLFEDYDIIYELSRFVAKGPSYEAEEGCHDDLAMCIVIFSWMATQKYFKEITDVDVRMKIYEQNESMLQDQLLPMGIRNIGPDEEVEIVIDESPESRAQLTEDQIWLLGA